MGMRNILEQLIEATSSTQRPIVRETERLVMEEISTQETTREERSDTNLSAISFLRILMLHNDQASNCLNSLLRRLTDEDTWLLKYI